MNIDIQLPSNINLTRITQGARRMVHSQIHLPFSVRTKRIDPPPLRGAL